MSLVDDIRVIDRKTEAQISVKQLQLVAGKSAPATLSLLTCINFNPSVDK